jgi:putative component of membrane protein insertase Oxa1/YidC/SpoIIIJ protein YidD
MIRTGFLDIESRSDQRGRLESHNAQVIHLFVDNARYHHAKLVQAWLARLECRIKLRFIPTCSPYPRSASRLEPFERLRESMHKHITHNRCHETFADFKAAVLTFLREEMPRK